MVQGSDDCRWRSQRRWQWRWPDDPMSPWCIVTVWWSDGVNGLLVRWPDGLLRLLTRSIGPMVRWWSYIPGSMPMPRWSRVAMVRWLDGLLIWWVQVQVKAANGLPGFQSPEDPMVCWSDGPMIRWSDDLIHSIPIMINSIQSTDDRWADGDPMMIRWSDGLWIRWSDDDDDDDNDNDNDNDNDPMVTVCWANGPMIRWSSHTVIDPMVCWLLLRLWVWDCWSGPIWLGLGPGRHRTIGTLGRVGQGQGRSGSGSSSDHRIIRTVYILN